MYFASLDIIRVLGFVWVFLHHIQIPILLIKENGWIGMDLLFALSGFLITSNLLKTDNLKLKTFYLRRALRIWPLYFFYLLVIGHYDQTWAYALLMGNWRVMLYGWSSFTLVGHLWAISMQEQFYMFYPLLFKHAKNLSLVLVFGICFSTLLKFLVFDAQNYFTIYMNTFTRLEPFFLGALLAIYKDKLSPKFAWIIFVLGLISFNLINIRESANIWIVVFGYLWVSIWCGSFLTILFKIKNLKFKIITNLAKLGFGMYVWHKVAIDYYWQIPLFVPIATVALATLTYKFIELPIQKYLRPPTHQGK